MSLKVKKIWNTFTKSGVVLILFILIFTSMGVGIARSVISNETKTIISLVLSTRNNEFFTDIETSIKESISNNHDYELRVFDSQDDDSMQTKNVENALALGTKALIINVVNSATAWEGSLKAVFEKNIPIIAVDRAITSPENTIKQTIASDNVAGARELANWFKQAYSVVNANVFHLQGVAGSQAAIDRSIGFKEGFGKEYSFEEIANFNKDQALVKTADVLQANGDRFNIIFADNDNMALGAIEAIKQKNLQAVNIKPYTNTIGNYYVLGFDGTTEALQAVKQGTLAATVIQQPKLMGQIAITSVIKILNGEIVEVIQAAQTVVVSSENIDNYFK